MSVHRVFLTTDDDKHDDGYFDIIDTQETLCAGCGADITGTAGQVRGYCCIECEEMNRPATPAERLAMAGQALVRGTQNAARGLSNTARGLWNLATDTRGRRRTFTVRAVMHRGHLNGSWCWCLMFGTLEGCIGAGYIGGFTFYVARRCYFQPRGDYRTRFAHIGLTMNANRPPLPRG